MALPVGLPHYRLVAEDEEDDREDEGGHIFQRQRIRNLSTPVFRQLEESLSGEGCGGPINFIAWKSCREENLVEFQKVVAKLDSFHGKANFVQTVASGAGFISSCIGIMTAITTDSGASNALSQGCEKVGSLSSSVSSAAYVTDTGYSEILLQRVRGMLQRDEKLLMPIRRWFLCHQGLANAFQEQCGTDAMRYIFEKLRNLNPKAENAFDADSSKVNDVLVEICIELMERRIPLLRIEEIIKLCTLVCRSPTLLHSIEKINSLLSMASRMLPLVKQSVDLSLRLLASREVSSVSNCQSSDLKTSSDGSTSTPWSEKLRQGVNTGVSLYSLYHGVKGPALSNYSVIISETINHLEAELALVSKMYEDLRKTR